MRLRLVALALVAGCTPAPAAFGPPAPTTTVTSAKRTTTSVTTAPVTTPSVTAAAAPTVVTSTSVPRRSPFPIASLNLALVDTGRPTVSHGRLLSTSRALPTTVWYPAAGPGPWPLVVFGHGYGVGPTPYTHLVQTWAAAGYVVAVPTFPLADQAIDGANLDEADLQNEPTDISFVITSVLRLTQVDPRHIAVTGHSDGGEAALSDGFQPGLVDPRVQAVIAMSVQPVPAPPTYPTGPRPVLFVQGDADTINPPGLGRAAYDQAAAPRFYLDLLGGGHLPPFAGGTRWQPVVEQVTTAFLDRYLSGRTSTAGALLADGNQPGVSSLDSSEKS
jgi:fermentation-respiration switch protein FrsA (DUF1100 family)